jgi:hypothetical protein
VPHPRDLARDAASLFGPDLIYLAHELMMDILALSARLTGLVIESTSDGSGQGFTVCSTWHIQFRAVHRGSSTDGHRDIPHEHLYINVPTNPNETGFSVV